MAVRPTGYCFCGCGEKTSPNAYFKVTHDRKAETMLIRMKFGSIADFVHDSGFGPHGKSLNDEFTAWVGKGRL
jgi:hypothetical protein